MLNRLKTSCVLLLSLLITACGGGGSANTTTSVAPASVSVIVTDASINDWDQAIATLTSIELIGDDGRDTLFDGRRTVDLLQLRDFVEVFEIDEDVRPGTYSKIRLRVEQLTLVRLDENGDVEEERDADLVANGKIDLSPRGDFDIPPGAVLFITLDFDLEKSFKLTETGNGSLKLRPVVFVQIDTAPAFRGLARIEGTVVRLSDDLDGFLVCRTQLSASPLDTSYSNEDIPDDQPRCLRVVTDADTGVFGEDGLPLDALGIAEDDYVTIIGRLARRMDEPDIEPIGDGSLTADDDDSDAQPFILGALTIEQGSPGTWQRVSGIAQSGISDDQFALAIAPSQGFAPDTVIDALLFEKTRLFSPRGNELDRSALVAGSRILADAVLAISDTAPDALRTALIIVGDETAADSLEAELLNIDGDTLNVATVSGDRCVITAGATILRVAEGDLDIDEIALEELENGEMLEIFGIEDSVSGCFDADVVIAKPNSPVL